MAGRKFWAGDESRSIKIIALAALAAAVIGIGLALWKLPVLLGGN